MRKCALIIGHPGHELRVLGWVRETRPLVIVLTDGSGHSGPSRLDISAAVLRGVGARLSNLFGVISDRQLYEVLLAGNVSVLTSIIERMVEVLHLEQIDCVVGDALEGYNPAHDVCRLVIDSAVELTSRRASRSIENLCFPLVGKPLVPDWEEAWRLSLDEGQLAEKLAVSRRYAQAAGGTLLAELNTMIQAIGEAEFAIEALYASRTSVALERFQRETPYYELHGADRVAAGLYAQVIRFHSHFRPLAAALERWLESGACPIAHSVYK